MKHPDAKRNAAWIKRNRSTLVGRAFELRYVHEYSLGDASREMNLTRSQTNRLVRIALKQIAVKKVNSLKRELKKAEKNPCLMFAV